MSAKLKKFITEHRKEFDTNEPAKDLWKKIDAHMDVKSPSQISSKWLSNYKYLGFSVSLLIVTLFFITKNFSTASSGEQALNKKDSEQTPQAAENRSEFSATENNTTKELNAPALPQNKPQQSASTSSLNTRQHNLADYNHSQNIEKDSVPGPTSSGSGSFANSLAEEEKSRPENSSGALSKEPREATNTSQKVKTEVYMPEEPEKMNTYTGTLYEGASLCEVLHIYKFPGKANLDRGSRTYNNENRSVMKTISCGRLESMKNIKAVWFMGKTDKELSIPVKEKFKNMVLVKSDGREVYPEAISHYYPGLGAISEYTGRYFNMVFKDKVGLLLFFKDAEEGDKILIDGAIEAIVKRKP